MMSFRQLSMGAIALLVASCSAAPTPWHRFVADEEGFSIAFPEPAEARRAHEGPLAKAYIARARDAQSHQYEVALFVLPKALDKGERARLLMRVERGLTGRPGASAAEVGDVAFHGRVARAMAVHLEPGQRGRWLVFYDGPRRMFQLSVVGPDRPALAARSTSFFESFRLRPDR